MRFESESVADIAELIRTKAGVIINATNEAEMKDALASIQAAAARMNAIF